MLLHESVMGCQWSCVPSYKADMKVCNCMEKPRIFMEEVPVVDQKGDSKGCWNWKTVFAEHVCVAYSVKKG